MEAPPLVVWMSPHVAASHTCVETERPVTCCPLVLLQALYPHHGLAAWARPLDGGENSERVSVPAAQTWNLPTERRSLGGD